MECCRVLKNIEITGNIGTKWVNLFQSSVALHVGTSHLILAGNQMIGFYLKCKIGQTSSNNKLNVFKVNNKYTATASVNLFCKLTECFHVNFEHLVI